MNHEEWTQKFLKETFKEKNLILGEQRAILEENNTDILSPEFERIAEEETMIEEVQSDLEEKLLSYAAKEEEQ